MAAAARSRRKEAVHHPRGEDSTRAGTQEVSAVAYLNVDEIETAVENLATAYPDTTEVITPPNLPHEGRQTHALRLGLGDDRDTVLILGGMHAREWVPPDALISLAAHLLEAHDRGTGL